MKEMTNWCVCDQMRVTSLHINRQTKVLGKLIPETGWCMTERAVVDLQRKVGERGLWHLKNDCCDGAEQRWDYIDMKVEWWWGFCMWEKECYSLWICNETCHNYSAGSHSMMTFSRSWVWRLRSQTTFPKNALLRQRHISQQFAIEDQSFC